MLIDELWLRPRLAGTLTTILLLAGACIVFLSFLGSPAIASTPDACPAMRSLKDSQNDAAPALQHCLDSLPSGGSIGLPPGSYVIRSPITIRKSVMLTTAGSQSFTPACQLSDRKCATLMPAMEESAIARAPMPIDIEADNVTIDRIVFAGNRASSPQSAKALCLSAHGRSLGGGLRWSGQHIKVSRSVFRDFACYSAFEIGTGSGSIIANIFANNGSHDHNMMWADGLTIHDGKHLVIRNNHFLDNTDVQLITGGCQDCEVIGNRFRHSIDVSGGSFAELMIQAWPGGATSGRYDGSVFADNDIDCGAAHRCGFGIMVGSLPWYQAPTSGGTVKRNRVRNAMLGLNIDGLSGPVDVGANTIVPAPGRYVSNCGDRVVSQGVNIAPSSRPFVSNWSMAAAASSDSYEHCILNAPALSL